MDNKDEETKDVAGNDEPSPAKNIIKEVIGIIAGTNPNGNRNRTKKRGLKWNVAQIEVVFEIEDLTRRDTTWGDI